MVAALGGVAAGRDGQAAFERLAHLGALLARDGEELGVVVGGEVAREAGVDVLLAGPALPLGQGTTAQLNRGHAERFRHRRGTMSERCRDDGTVGQYPTTHRDAAAHKPPTDDRPPENGTAAG